MNDYQILKDAIPGYVERAQSWIENQLDKSSTIKDYYSKILEIFENAFSDLKENFNDYLPQIFGAISSFVGEVSDLVIGVILSIYFLVSRKTISGIINKIFVAILPMGAAQHLSEVIIRLYRNTFPKLISSHYCLLSRCVSDLHCSHPLH
jgi:predicted PurR-regulated permease PerM